MDWRLSGDQSNGFSHSAELLITLHLQRAEGSVNIDPQSQLAQTVGLNTEFPMSLVRRHRGELLGGFDRQIFLEAKLAEPHLGLCPGRLAPSDTVELRMPTVDQRAGALGSDPPVSSL